MTEIKIGNNPLLLRIFAFDDLETGRKLAEENYGIKNFLSITQEKDFKKLKIMFPDNEIHGWEYGMFKTEREFWVFRNKGNGFLYGTGRYIKGYSKASE
ncbi:MAG: hypothetical protein KBT11_01655 [Treponema sp.]|nr:hypothetical protein [Candidatus Treponema equifaecale]